MNIEVKKGDVVLVSFPHKTDAGQLQTKRRPAVVVSNDDNNASREDVLVVPLTSNSAQAAREPSRVVVLMHTPEGRSAGLRLDSVIDCSTVATIPKKLLVGKIGWFPREVMARVDKFLGQDDGGLGAGVPRKPSPIDDDQGIALELPDPEPEDTEA
jgi:Growth inhibitor